jgi:hypothetical protein
MNLMDANVFTEMAHLAGHVDSKVTIEIDTNDPQFPVTYKINGHFFQAREVSSTTALAALVHLSRSVQGEIYEENQKIEAEEAKNSTNGAATT